MKPCDACRALFQGRDRSAAPCLCCLSASSLSRDSDSEGRVAAMVTACSGGTSYTGKLIQVPGNYFQRPAQSIQYDSTRSWAIPEPSVMAAFPTSLNPVELLEIDALGRRKKWCGALQARDVLGRPLQCAAISDLGSACRERHAACHRPRVQSCDWQAWFALKAVLVLV
jgi:hypothetical protein